MNLTHRFLQETGQTLEDYDGLCMELVNDMIGWLKQDSPAQRFCICDKQDYHYIWIEGGEGQYLEPVHHKDR